MPKLKVRSSVKKRFRLTKNGKIMARHAFNRHLKAKKSRSHKMALSKPKQIVGFFAKKLRKAMGMQ